MATKKTEEPKDKTKPSLARVIAEINKKAGETVIGKLADIESVISARVPSGVPGLDEVLGGGWPLGRMVELYGLESAGKSLVAQRAIAEAQKMGLECIYVDCEASFDPVFATKLGVDVPKLSLVQGSVGEDTIDIIAKLLAAEPGVIVIDSVASMVTKAEMEADAEQIQMAPKARMMSKALAKLNALNSRTLIIFINQLRNIITTWGGGGTTTPGGLALRFYSSIRLEVKKIEPLRVDGKKTTDIIGQLIGFETKKNKTASPFQHASFKFWYDGARIE